MKKIPLALALAGTILIFPAGKYALRSAEFIEVPIIGLNSEFRPIQINDDRDKEKRAPDFELEDQFRNKKNHHFPKDRWSVIFVAGRKGAEQIEPWAKAIYDIYGESVEQIGIADVSSVPGPLQGLIRSLFRKTITYPILMDWEGKVVHKIGYQKDKVRLLVVSPEGKIKEVYDGPLSESAKSKVLKALPEPEKAES